MNRELCDLNNLNKPSCKYGYTRNDLVKMGLYTIEFLEWMRGKTYCICENSEFCKGDSHGDIYYAHDVEKYIRMMTSRDTLDLINNVSKFMSSNIENDKNWIIDQALRMLMGENKYKQFRDDLEKSSIPYDEGKPPIK